MLELIRGGKAKVNITFNHLAQVIRVLTLFKINMIDQVENSNLSGHDLYPDLQYVMRGNYSTNQKHINLVELHAMKELSGSSSSSKFLSLISF